MKKSVLGVKQPWGNKILSGEKTHEIRTTDTKKRGEIYLYSTRSKPDVENYDGLRGYILGSVEIYDTLKITNVDQFSELSEFHCVPVERFDRVCFSWIMRNPVLFENPIPFKFKPGQVVWSSIDI